PIEPRLGHSGVIEQVTSHEHDVDGLADREVDQTSECVLFSVRRPVGTEMTVRRVQHSDRPEGHPGSVPTPRGGPQPAAESTVPWAVCAATASPLNPTRD